MEETNSNNQQRNELGESHISQVSKEAIRLVFDKFDKNKNNFIELNEIQQLANELQMSNTESQQCQTALEEIDVNKDGKISFEEFWDFWRREKSGVASLKMDKLIYLKLKGMKLLNQANSEFIRYGGSLEQEYEDKVYDTHYVSLNIMEVIGKIQLNLTGLFSHEELIEERKLIFQKSIDDNILQENDLKEFTGLSIKIISQNEHLAKQYQPQLEDLLIDFVRICRILNPYNSLYDFFSDAKIHTSTENKDLFGFVQIDKENINSIEKNEYIGKQIRLLLLYLKLSQMKIKSSLQLRNGFHELINKPTEKFVKWLFFGFIAQSKIIMNRGYLKKFRSILKAKLESKQLKGKNKKLQNSAFLATILNSSKVRITFKDIQDMEEMFQGLGLEELSKDQPTNLEILTEFSQKFKNFMKLMENNTNKQFSQNPQQHQQQNQNNINKQNSQNSNFNSSQMQKSQIQEQHYKTLQIYLAKILQLLHKLQAEQIEISVGYKKNIVKVNVQAQGLYELINKMYNLQHQQ